MESVIEDKLIHLLVSGDVFWKCFIDRLDIVSLTVGQVDYICDIGNI